MKSLTTYLKNVRGELSHVVWPPRKQALMHTALIILVSALVALLITALDYAFTGVVARFVTGY